MKEGIKEAINQSLELLKVEKEPKERRLIIANIYDLQCILDRMVN